MKGLRTHFWLFRRSNFKNLMVIACNDLINIQSISCHHYANICFNIHKQESCSSYNYHVCLESTFRTAIMDYHIPIWSNYACSSHIILSYHISSCQVHNLTIYSLSSNPNMLYICLKLNNAKMLGCYIHLHYIL